MDINKVEWQIIANPNALTEKRKILETKIFQKLEERGVCYQLHFADGTGHGIQVSKSLCEQGHRHLMIVGGDGSINEIVNGIYLSRVNPEEVYLAIIPLGTGNDFCRTLSYPAAEKAVDFLFEADFLPTDVGTVVTLKGNQEIARRHFINIAGFAFDAAVINETVHGKPKIFPSAVYLLKLIKVLFSYKSIPVTLNIGDIEKKEHVFTIAIGNAQYNGNGMKQVPMGNPQDGFLDVVVIRKIHPLKVIANVKKLYAGKHLSLKEVVIKKVKSLKINSEQLLLGEVEGEMLTQGNYHIHLEPKRLNILGKKDAFC